MPTEHDILAELRNLYREKRELDRAIQSLEKYQRLLEDQADSLARNPRSAA